MYLTEQQIKDRTELFFDIISDLAEDLYDVSDDHEPTEEDLYITSIMMEHFIETIKVPSLNESVQWVVTGQDPNKVLYDELIDAMLDESIGSMVAGVAHGVQGAAAKIGKALAQRRAASLKQKASSAKAQAKQVKNAPGVIGALKRGFYQAKADKLSNKASKAATNRDAAVNKVKAVQTRKSRLAKKIDTGIQNVKSRVKSAITGGAASIGSAAGRLAS
jgi:hypothetical protein